MNKILLVLSLFLSLLIGCSSDDDYSPIAPEAASPVSFDLSRVPYSNLSEYKFYEGDMKDMSPSLGVLPYKLINKLFTDYATKSRFVWMPDGTTAQYIQDEQILEFPVGAVMVKNFYYDRVAPSMERKIIETRLIYKTATGWEFADYLWNDEQTDATYDLDGSVTRVDFELDGSMQSVDYRIPSRAECITCHKKNDDASPIGPKPFNLNSDLTYADGIENQLVKLEQMGYVSGLPASISQLPDWRDTSFSLQDRFRSYAEINCAHCHNDLGHCAYREIRFDYLNSTTDESLGICVDPEEEVGVGQTHIVRAGVSRRSALYHRLSTNEPSERMPLLGRTIVDQEAVALVETWIESMDNNCN
ncbi:MAG: hypothetical protein WBA16_04080 [Nonlabens sp.]